MGTWARQGRWLAGTLGALCLGVSGAGSAERPSGPLWNWYYVLDLNTGTRREVLDGPAGFVRGTLRWSADSRKLLYQREIEGNEDLWALDLATGQETNLTNSPEADYGGPFSPDGRWMAFTRGQGSGRSEIWVMRPDGTEQRQLTHDPRGAGGAAWSPDGRQMAFVRAREGEAPQIWVMEADGSRPRQLTHDPLGGSFPVWSPDGRRIGFMSVRAPRFQQVWVVNADGTQAQQVSDEDTTARSGVIWSHDSQRLVYVSHAGGCMDLTVVDLQRGTRRRITEGREVEDSAAWSRDDRKLLVTRSHADGTLDKDLYLVDVEGRGEVRLTNEPGYHSAIRWSPDNRQIYFQRRGEIWVMDADGSQQRSISGPAPQGGFWGLQISPDFRWVVGGRTGYR